MADKNKSRAFRLAPLASAVAAAVLSTSALAVEFHGYARAGISTTADGGEQLCYGSGAAGHFVGRLGDECDTYGEMALGQELFAQDGKTFRFDMMLAYQALNQGNDYQALDGDNDLFSTGGDTNASEPWQGGDIALRQAFVSAKNVIGWAPGATLWAGKRFYGRKDVHWLDLFYVNNSGYGAGLENISVGNAKASVAVTNFDTPARHSGNGYTQNNKLDVRFSMPAGAGNLELIGIYGYADLTDAQDQNKSSLSKEVDRNGFFLTAEYSQGLMGGFNKAVLQYGKGSLGHMAYANHGGGESLNSVWWDGTLEKSWRVMDFGVARLSDKVELGYSVLYQKGTTYGSGVTEENPSLMSVVVRPMYKWDDIMKTTLELGYSKNQEPWEAEKKALSKIVVAQEWSAGKSFWARPTIRLYAGSFFGKRAEENTSHNADGEKGNLRVGAQFEAWW
ncbi:maltoporin LamB [Hahella sp. SMD15-11]|uniref:Maltoporin LamB n=1 Tax=Thermohahella caldifontis TaxID=3142973 RepID=A0AB39UTE1_9GAMM